MRIVLDIEANALRNPTKIWLIVCKDIDTNRYHIFRDVTQDEESLKAFVEFTNTVTMVIGHNLLEYDLPNINNLMASSGPFVHRVLSEGRTCDTLILSRMVEYSRTNGHSIEAYGEELGLPKIEFNDWTKWSQPMEDYCVRDVDICHRIYNYHKPYLTDTANGPAIKHEHEFQVVCNSLSDNGFYFNTDKANKLLDKVSVELSRLDKEILDAFPPRLRMVKEVTPKITKHGTLSRTDFRFVKDGNLSEYNGGPFCRCAWVPFNPASHKQLIDVLHEAKWKPQDKTQAHIDTERKISAYKRSRNRDNSVDLVSLYARMVTLEKYGWKINETNLSTLPLSAPSPARLLAKRIQYESRRRTLTEWLGLVHPDTDRIHGKFLGIGAWTHRMAHQQPNTANIPNEYELSGKKKLLGKELRGLWSAPKNRLLVGVDAEGIQLRIFAHLIDDAEFTKSLVEGRKDDKTDPHSLNQRVLGSVCRSRAAAKRFIYALLLGAGLWKLSQILECSEAECKKALDILLERYTGFATLKQEVIPNDARHGYFIGLDGRKVKIPGDTIGERRHLSMSGYLQNGEKVIMERATLKWAHKLKNYDSMLVNLVHDEWQTECPNDMKIALKIAKMQADSLVKVGEELKLKCPLAGSYWNEDHQDYTIGTNWSVTH